MLNIGKHTAKVQIYYKQKNLLLLLIKLLLRHKALISNKELSNSVMSKNSSTRIRDLGKKVHCHTLKLKNLKMSTVQSKIILITMMVYSKQLGKSLMIKKLQKLRVKKLAIEEILILLQKILLMTGQELSMQSTGKHMAKDQIQYKLMRLLLILIQSCLLLKLKVALVTKKLSNSEMSKNSSTRIRNLGKKVLYHTLILKNSRTFIVSSKIILITMMVYSRQLGKSIMIKKLQKLQLKKIATKEILMNYQENS